MAMTNAERQAAHKARRTEMLETLTKQNAALLEEVATLRAELDAAKERAHRLEVAALRAQLRQQAEREPKATAPAPKRKTPTKRAEGR